MFKRRNKKPLWHSIREAVWPKAGWLRVFSYLGHRIGRLPGSAYAISCGLACGAAVSFTPFIGLHFGLSALLSWLLRGNILAAFIGTAVGNPWTFPFIWVSIFNIGKYILGMNDGMPLPETMSIFYIFDNFWAVFIPMMLGGIILCIIVWPLFFFPVQYVIEKYQTDRKMVLEGKKTRKKRSSSRKKNNKKAV